MMSTKWQATYFATMEEKTMMQFYDECGILLVAKKIVTERDIVVNEYDPVTRQPTSNLPEIISP